MGISKKGGRAGSIVSQEVYRDIRFCSFVCPFPSPHRGTIAAIQMGLLATLGWLVVGGCGKGVGVEAEYKLNSEMVEQFVLLG